MGLGFNSLRRWGKVLAAIAFVTLAWVGAASAQQVNMYCWVDNGPPIHWAPCNSTTPLVIGPSPYNYTPLTPMQASLAITTSTALTIPTGATYAVVCAAGTNVNYTTDGTTAPTASVGMPLLQNQCVSLSGATVLTNFRAIQQAATATLNVSYFK